MLTKKIKINIPKDLEARPIALLVQVASQFESSIYLEYENKRVNAKSIMGMMTISLNIGEEVTVSVTGNDEIDAMNNIERYLSETA